MTQKDFPSTQFAVTPQYGTDLAEAHMGIGGIDFAITCVIEPLDLFIHNHAENRVWSRFGHLVRIPKLYGIRAIGKLSYYAHDKNCRVVEPAALPDNPNVVLDNCTCGNMGDYNLWYVLVFLSSAHLSWRPGVLSIVDLLFLHKIHIFTENSPFLSRPIHPLWSIMYQVWKGFENVRLRC